LDSRIGSRFLSAGLGWGGSCFGKDTAALVATGREYGLTMPIVEAARWVNQRQRDRVIEKLLQEVKIIKGRTIALLGLAFKPNTDDLREAPAVEIAQKLIERGATVRAHDPIAMERFEREHQNLGVQLCDNIDNLIEDCDAAILVTEWTEYREIEWDKAAPTMRGKVVLDGRLALDREKIEKAGLRYVSISG
jgi:UDPglucose 6-dehydrogenase